VNVPKILTKLGKYGYTFAVQSYSLNSPSSFGYQTVPFCISSENTLYHKSFLILNGSSLRQKNHSK
jgi:hypothetical protein